MIPRGALSLGVLAGGRGERQGGRDKAWIDYRGLPLIDHALARFDAPFEERLVSARDEDARHAARGLRVVLDRRPGFAGPAAGLEALAFACRTPWLLSLPVDQGPLPPGLAEALWHARSENGAVVRDAGGLQPLLALWHAPTLAVHVLAALEAGHGAVHALVETLRLAPVDLSPRRLSDFNTPDSLLDPP